MSANPNNQVPITDGASLDLRTLSVPERKQLNINGFKLFTPTEDVSNPKFHSNPPSFALTVQAEVQGRASEPRDTRKHQESGRNHQIEFQLERANILTDHLVGSAERCW